MEPIKSILSNLKPPNSEKTDDSLRSLMERGDRLRREISLLYASARKEIPEAAALEVEVTIALRELEEIPDSELSVAFDAAKVEAGAFVPSNGLIIKCYRGEKGKNFEDAQKAIRLENTRRYLAPPSNDLPTADERAALAAGFAALADSLKGGSPNAQIPTSQNKPPMPLAG
jgi:hypothetical protein